MANFKFKEANISAAASSATCKLGFLQMKPEQRRVVEAILKGRDVFVSLPTGSGKSLCYSILPDAFDILRSISEASLTRSIVIVVSPLIALMKDQVQSLDRKGVKAAFLHSRTCDETKAGICEGQYQLLFMSPETLLQDKEWRDILQSPVYQENVVALAVDEAHCVKKWGETFRKEFSKLGEVRSLIPENVNIMALTATATKVTRSSICSKLGLVKPVIVSKSPNKPNIKFSIVKREDSSLEETFAPLVEKLRSRRKTFERTIIFCHTYDSMSQIYLYLRNRLEEEFTHPIAAPDLPRFRLVDMFSACTRQDVKDTILQRFSSDSSLRVVVATIAFGMGIDCPDVRRIIHWGPPSDIESYIQETGRAGRDGLPAFATLYFTDAHLGPQHIETNMKEYCRNEVVCRRQMLFQDFDEPECNVSVTGCKCCDICSVICSCSECSFEPLLQ